MTVEQDLVSLQLLDAYWRAANILSERIAATVFLAEGTAKNYVSRIMDKLHARSRVELALRAVDRRA